MTPNTAASKKPVFASADSEGYVQTGLANNFWGVVEREYLQPFKYGKGKKTGQYYLAHVLEIRADDTDLGKDGLVTDRTKIADLSQWIPATEDGEPVGATPEEFLALSKGEATVDDSALEQLRGIYLIPGAANSQSAPPKGTGYDFLAKNIKKAGFKGEIGFAFNYLEGHRAYWSRIDLETSGMELEPGQRQPQVLCPIEFEEVEKPKSAAKKATVKKGVTAVGEASGAGDTTTVGPKAGAPATSKVAPRPATSPATKPVSATPSPTSATPATGTSKAAKPYGEAPKTDALVVEAITSALQGMEEGSAHRTDLANAAFEVAQGKGVNRINDPAWLTAAAEADGRFTFDAASGVLTLVGVGEEEGEEEEIEEEEEE